MHSRKLLSAAMVSVLVATPVGIAPAQEQTPPEGERLFRLSLPEWNPDPESLPPELRPLDVVRPELPEAVAAEVAELEARIVEIENSWFDAETREAQDAALDVAIGLAVRVLAIREENQGNTPEHIRWRDGAGGPSEWHEVFAARQKVADLRLMRGLGEDDRAALGTLMGSDDEVVRLHSAGKYAEAQVVTERQLAVRRRVLGNEHPSTLTSINNMGFLLLSQGSLSEAEPYYREALEGLRRVSGNEHPHTLTSIGNMGALLRSQGRLSEAEPYFRQALEGRRRVSGNEHPHTLTSIGNMGALLSSQGRLAEAEPYYREALEGLRRVLGDEHPSTLTSINNMGALLQSRGRLAEAELYYREALEGSRRVLGDEHPSTLTSINNMGTLLDSQGRLSEAELYFREALDGFRRVLGDAHPDTLRSINNMGGLLDSQGRLSEAEPYYREALEGSRRVLGDEHPSTLTSINNIGGLLESQGRLSEAEPYWREALEGSRRVLGDDHPYTLTSINNIGGLLESQGRLSEAEPYYREALEGSRRVLGEEHPSTLTSINSMASLLASQGKLAEAEPLFAEALATAERLRVDIAGDASARAQFAGALNLTGIATNYTRTLIALGRAAEALGVLERGRGRAGLDLFAGGRSVAEEALRASADEAGLARYDAALAAEAEAQLAVFEAEARLSKAPDEEKPARRDEMLAARRSLSEKTAAVFNELRGLVPAVDPMTTDQMLAALSPGEALVTWAWADGGVVALVAREGRVTGVTLAEGHDEAMRLVEALWAMRERITTRGGAMPAGVLDAARDAALPEALRELLAGASSVIAVADGPLAGIPVELLLPEVPVAYTPTATIALRPRLDGAAPTRLASSGGVIVGDPVFAGFEREEPDYPDPLLALAKRSPESLAASATALEQIRFYGGGLSPLPATRLEAAAIASMLGEDATLLMGPDATAPRLRAAMESAPPRILHLATHGLLGTADRPLLASVALTTPAEPTGEDNGFVTLGDILATWGGQLRDTELVTLSACDTASAVRQGDTMMALPLGLLISGAETVVASLWKVDDRATALLMARFYANWLGKAASEREINSLTYSPGQPLPKLAALREAQAWLRGLTRGQVDTMTGSPDAVNQSATRDPSPRRGRLVTTPDPDAKPYEHPFYWSAFVLYGSPE